MEETPSYAEYNPFQTNWKFFIMDNSFPVKASQTHVTADQNHEF